MTFMILTILVGCVLVAGGGVLLHHRRKDKQLDYNHQLKMTKALDSQLKDE